MQTKKDILNFCNDALCYDYKNIEDIEKLNMVRNCIIKIFCETIPSRRIIVSLSIIDNMISKILDNDIDDIVRRVHSLRENVIYIYAVR